MIFDTHIHLNDKEFINNLDHYISEANKNGVKKFLCVGYDVQSSIQAVEIASKYEGVYVAIGVIPTEHKTYDDKTINELEKLLNKNKKIIAIGEIGLDYYWENECKIIAKQKQMFIEQIKLANKYQLPISIHARNSLNDVFSILKEYPVEKRGVMHCFSGTYEEALNFISLGFKIAIGGVLTFKNAVNLHQIAEKCEIKDIVLETDAPYLAPVPFRGKTNEPKYIAKVLEAYISRVGKEEKLVEETLYNNACEIFHVER